MAKPPVTHLSSLSPLDIDAPAPLSRMPALAELDFQLSDTFLASNSMLCFSNLQDVSLSLDSGPKVTLSDSTACHHIFLSHSTTLLPMGSSPSFWTVSRRPAATPLSISRWNHTRARSYATEWVLCCTWKTRGHAWHSATSVV